MSVGVYKKFVRPMKTSVEIENAMRCAKLPKELTEFNIPELKFSQYVLALSNFIIINTDGYGSVLF